jgi:hypothetical protein
MNAIREDMKDHPLAQAAREVNAYAEKHGLEETCEHYGFKIEDVKYIAEQRALRAIYAFRGVNLNMKEPQIVGLTRAEIPTYIQLTAAYMDALVIGWRAKEITMTDLHEGVKRAREAFEKQ